MVYILLISVYYVVMSYSGPQINIIYEDEYLLAVNKPAGLVVHSDGRTEEASLTDWVIEKYPDIENVGGLHTLDNERYVNRAGILHRLDRETSGVILIAKKDDVFWSLQQQFISHSIQKIYLAFCEGVPKEKEGVIEFDIGRSRSDYRQWTVAPFARGTLRKSITKYKLIDSFKKDNSQFSLIEFRPKTGRTHQIRVHAKASGFPIVSDERYETKKALGFDRVALHAKGLIFKHPVSNKIMELEAELPSDFEDAIKLFKK